MAGLGLEVSELSVSFGRKPALAVAQLSAPAGSFVALTGPSGSGKTTLLHVLAGILRPGSGSVRWGDSNVVLLREGARDVWRRTTVGLIFQDFHLIEQLSPLNNVILPSTFSSLITPEPVRRRAIELLEQFGVPLERRSVNEMSRGERQRVAIARALLFNPPVLLADEPTASLDEDAAEEVAAALANAAASGRTTIVVSHDPIVIRRCARVIRLERGHIVGDDVQNVGTYGQNSEARA